MVAAAKKQLSLKTAVGQQGCNMTISEITAV